MRKLLFPLALLVFCTGAFASLNKTGTIYYENNDEDIVDVYASPGCAAAFEWEQGPYIAPKKNDVRAVFNEKKNWYEISVAKAMPNDDFCIYTTIKCNSMYEEDCEAQSEPSYRYQESFTKENFLYSEDLYIIDNSPYIPYSLVPNSKVYLRAPKNWSKVYISNNDIVVKNQPDKWIEFTKNELVNKTVKTSYKTIGYKDTIKIGWHSEYSLSKLTIIDTIAIDSSYSSELYYQVHYKDTVAVKKIIRSDTLTNTSYTTIYKTIGYDTTIVERSIYAHDFINESENIENIIDTISIDSSLAKEYDDYGYIIYNVRVKEITPIREVSERKYQYFTFTNGSNSYIDSVFDALKLSKEMYVFEDPNNTGKTIVTSERPNFKVFYLLLPNTLEWFSAIPMISSDKGNTGKILSVDNKYCGWFKTVFFNETLPTAGLVYSATDKSLSFGNASGKPINFETLFANSDTVYFDANTGKTYKKDPKITGVCNYTFAGIIYDTDETLNPLFSSYTKKSSKYKFVNYCIGIHHGTVKETLGDDHKPQLNIENPNGEGCFVNEENFNTLFNHVDGVNESSCYNFTLGRLEDGRWGYSSDEAITDNTLGGFYPVENKSDDEVFTDRVPAATTKRLADGPAAYSELPEGIEKMEHVCNGPGWDGGVDCEGGFITDDIVYYGDWQYAPTGGLRWTDKKRNQHFCFESHAEFTYQKGQTFVAIGDDDVWVFIAGKLAIDNGGTHLAAPGYVDLDIITDKNGKALVPGKKYDFDLFFCDRRTTMSNMTFKTNIYLTQVNRAEELSPCAIPNDQDIFNSSSSEMSGSSSADSSSSPSSKPADDSSSQKHSSSSEETDDNLIVKSQMERFIVMPYGRTLQITGASSGKNYSIFDLQGNLIRRGTTNSDVVNVTMNTSGTYLVKIGHSIQKVSIK